MASVPQPPGNVALGPGVVEEQGVLVRVHALPEALVPVGAQLALAGELLERLALEDAVRPDVLQGPRLEAEEPAVDPVLEAGLLAEPAHAAVALELGDPELELGPHHGH